MTLIDQKPAGLESTNQLDQIPDDLLGGPPPPADIKYSGAFVARLEDPPCMGEKFVMLVELEVIDVGERSLDGGETISPYRVCRRVGDMWLQGQSRPVPPKSKAELEAEAEAEAAENQPPLYGENGPVDGADFGEPETLGEIADELLGEELGDAEFGGRPPFSDESE